MASRCLLLSLYWPLSPFLICGLLSHNIQKSVQKWIKDLTIRPETVKLLEEKNIWEKLFDIGIGKDFFDMILKEQATTKIDK